MLGILQNKIVFPCTTVFCSVVTGYSKEQSTYIFMKYIQAHVGHFEHVINDHLISVFSTQEIITGDYTSTTFPIEVQRDKPSRETECC